MICKKEALAVTWGCEDYLHGTLFQIEIDHKPLVPLLSSKPLDRVPIRVQRFRLQSMRFSYTIAHVLREALNTAATLPRPPVNGVDNNKTFHQEVNAYVK